MPNSKINTTSKMSFLCALIIGSIFITEGEYSNDPDDLGGETKYGITQDVAIKNGYTGSMLNLTKEQARTIYNKEYIISPGFDKLIPIEPAIAHKVIDAGVNTGTQRATVWTQTALNALSRGGKDYPYIGVDGIMGSGTINAYKSLVKQRGKVKACTLVMKLIDAQQGVYYISLSNQVKYTVGWVDKRIGNVSLDQCSNFTLGK